MFAGKRGTADPCLNSRKRRGGRRDTGGGHNEKAETAQSAGQKCNGAPNAVNVAGRSDEEATNVEADSHVHLTGVTVRRRD